MLDPSADEIREWGKSAFDLIAEYIGGIRARRVYPQTSSDEIRRQLDAALPEDGTNLEYLLGTFRDVLIPLSRQNAHPRMFGYVQSPGVAIGALADLLASALNANLTVWRSAPAGVELERLTIDWIRQILGFAPGAGGLFVSGGSIANFSALATAREAAQHSLGKTLRVYASTETHHSIAKAARLLGMGRGSVCAIGVDDRFKIRIDELRAKITADIDAGHVPFCVIGNAGTVNTGACDPLREIRKVADEFGLWMHVDGSYGGFAILAEAARERFAGIADADSVALDPHKWLYLPLDCGCVIYRDPEAARATFAHDADYTRIIGHEADEAFAFWDYGPELSRRFRALKVWMLLKAVGLRALGDSIAKDLACARHLESLVRASDDFEMLAPVELSIACFRHVPAELRGKDEELNPWNERLLVALQRDGSSYLSNAMINGQFALRACVMNYRTTLRDMEILLADLRRVAELLPIAR
ncbi:MAG: pyridoxal-dependent decarboxylase [Verrucomicrobiota bacterium]|nr:pyridoxal-dependent decarboxylase [Verrucomicrobiota bacterium]